VTFTKRFREANKRKPTQAEYDARIAELETGLADTLRREAEWRRAYRELDGYIQGCLL
jgi:hypothetical protein